MNWFYGTFLPSLLDRAGTNNPMWLTRKQTVICIDNMDRHSVVIPQSQGNFHTHDNYTLEWDGRRVVLNYSKLNGCGQIIFGFTAAEAKEANREYEEEKRRESEERMERRRKWAAWARENDPDKLAQRIARHQANIDDLKEAIEDIQEDLIEAKAEEDARQVKLDYDALERAKKELAEAESVLAIYL